MEKEQFLMKLKTAISSVIRKIPENEDVFQFGIFTDQDVSSMLLIYNTYTHFADQLQKLFLKDHKIVSHYRWSMPEWFSTTGEDDDLFNEVNNLLYNVIQPNESEINPECFKRVILDLLATALLELREEGVFDLINKDIILYVEQADSFNTDKTRERVKKLLGEKYYEEFLYDIRDELHFRVIRSE